MPVDAQAWEGRVQLAYGCGDPADPLFQMAHQNAAPSVGITPTNIGPTVGRLVRFRVPTSIAVARFRWLSIASVSSLYTVGLYNEAGTQQFTLNPLNTGAAGWQSAAVNFTLLSGVYWMGIGAKAVGTTAGLRSLSAPLGSFNTMNGYPGGLAKLYELPRFAQVALTAGAWPATLPNIVAPAFVGGTSGTVPMFVLDSDSVA